MITNNSYTSFTYVRKLMVLPLAFLLLIACTKDTEQRIGANESNTTNVYETGSDTIRVSWEQLGDVLVNTKELSSTHVNGSVYITVDKKVYTMPFSEVQKMQQIENGSKTPNSQIFTKLDKEATFPGGMMGWMRYLNSAFEYPQVAIDKEIQGTVVIQFIVTNEGKVSDIVAISGPVELRAEAIRVIEGSGPWIAGEMNGQKVHSYKKQPITFRLQSE